MFRAQLKRFHQSDQGSMPFLNLFAILFALVLCVFVFNSSFILKQRVETQNAADAGASAVGEVTARYMNSLTGANHLMGEVLSLVIVHDAIGGENLDTDTPEPTPADDRLLIAHNNYASAAAAAGVSMTDIAFQTVSQAILASKSPMTMEFKAKERLKELLALVYHVQAAGYWMVATDIPPVVAAGFALHASMEPLELLILAEYEFLNRLHDIARAMTPIKMFLEESLLPEIKRYTVQLTEQYPLAAQEVMRQIAEMNGVTGAAISFEGELRLPVVIDPHAKAMTLLTTAADTIELATAGCCNCPIYSTQIDRDQIVKVTQLARATFPWVNYHRQPILDLLTPLMLSEAREAYKDATDGYSKYLCSKLQIERDLGLYVLAGYPGPDKGHALWTEDPDLADEEFAILSVVHRPAPQTIGTSDFFQQQHEKGTLAMSQVLLYNANPQVRAEHPIDLTCKRIVPNRQADIGWDTLNWAPGARPYELVAVTNRGGAPDPEFPRIQLNWQAKLVPKSNVMVKALHKNNRLLPAEIQSVTGRLLRYLPDAFQGN